MSERIWRNSIYFLFAISGFSGLIYESVWSHYLKLFLGHAAYAQTVVLIIFMGGMAIGAWLASRYSTSRKNPLLLYAIVEGLIGLAGLVFHTLFVNVTDFAYASLIPNIASPTATQLLKWTLSGAMILPQSILLGATFPLMSAGLVRGAPASSGERLATLYFTNSLGAAIGVLVSGFVLLSLVGLPGTLLTAGMINIVIALVVWLLVNRGAAGAAPRSTRASEKTGKRWRLMLLAALVTGAASFMYEIGWIRMMSLVLGSSTHAFELMLSAFILGLAFGGWWIRRHIDTLRAPLYFLAVVQVLMGLLAIGTLIAYNGSFDVMQGVMQALRRTDDGYRFFSMSGHLLALGIMLPATFCAGITLPLITNILIREGSGEKSIGAVYASNTFGAILGVLFAIHIGLPMLGIKGLIITGGAADIALGVVLLFVGASASTRWIPYGVSGGALAVIGIMIFAFQLDGYKMASGVYRDGALYRPGQVEITYHRDGKTSTVDLLKTGEHVSILNNGKPDALINLSPDGARGPDEYTMTMVAALPLLLHERPRFAANIGLGSGLTAHVLLADPRLEQVDTIEIESAVVEASVGFGARVQNVYRDPRSRIHVDDAKAFFANHRRRYDIIISEPPNPWVSGVAGLFSDEFYRHVVTHLNPDGLFVQWIQLYEINTELVASVMKALGKNFTDYAIYTSNDGDMIFVARRDGHLRNLSNASISPGLMQELQKTGFNGARDLSYRHLGDRALFEPMFRSFPVPANSDYFPFVDLNAERARFTGRSANEIAWLGIADIPLLEMLNADKPVDISTISRHTTLEKTVRAHSAVAIRDAYRGGLADGDGKTSVDADLVTDVAVSYYGCKNLRSPGAWLTSVVSLAQAALPYLPPADAAILTQRWRVSDCYRRLAPGQKELIELLHAVGQRDAGTMARLGEKQLQAGAKLHTTHQRYLLRISMLGYQASQQPREAVRIWNTYAKRALQGQNPDLVLRLLRAKSTADQSTP